MTSFQVSGYQSLLRHGPNTAHNDLDQNLKVCHCFSSLQQTQKNIKTIAAETKAQTMLSVATLASLILQSRRHIRTNYTAEQCRCPGDIVWNYFYNSRGLDDGKSMFIWHHYNLVSLICKKGGRQKHHLGTSCLGEGLSASIFILGTSYVLHGPLAWKFTGTFW